MLKGFKKSLFFTLILILALSVFPIAASAAEAPAPAIDQSILNEIEKTNIYVYDAIYKAGEDAVKEVLKNSHIIQNELNELDKLQETENLEERLKGEAIILQEIRNLELELNVSIQELCAKLIERTDKHVDELIRKAMKENIEIIQEYIEVRIYNQTILVDPCYAH